MHTEKCLWKINATSTVETVSCITKLCTDMNGNLSADKANEFIQVCHDTVPKDKDEGTFFAVVASLTAPEVVSSLSSSMPPTSSLSSTTTMSAHNNKNYNMDGSGCQLATI